MGRNEVPDVVDAWVRGWARSRSTPAPVTVPGGWRIDVGLHGHRLRYVLHGADDRLLAGLGRRENAPGTWIKAAADPAHLHAALPPGWTAADTGHLMTTTFRAAAAPGPRPPYTARVRVSGPVVVAVVLDADGRVAASGRLATAGAFGIIDRVETDPAHRRRGLGSAVMRVLASHALRRGAHTGVLVATDEGRDLYGTLDWTVRSPLAAAYVPESPAA